MDLNQLKSFVAVAHQGNLTQAAENLHLSQPAVSAQIKAIENHLNVQLFERNAQGMILTRAGATLLPEAEDLLRHMHRLDYFAINLSGSYKEILNIGIIHPLSSKKTALLAKYLTHSLPNVNLHFSFGLSGDIINSVRQKTLDAGFFLGTSPYRSIRSIFLEYIDYVLICHNDEYQIFQKNLHEQLKNSTWIDMSAASGSSKEIQNIWKQMKLYPHSKIACDRPSAMIDLTAQKLGISFVPRNAALKAIENNLPISLLEEVQSSIELHFIYHSEYEDNPLIKEINQLLDKVWPNKK